MILPMPDNRCRRTREVATSGSVGWVGGGLRGCLGNDDNFCQYQWLASTRWLRQTIKMLRLQTGPTAVQLSQQSCRPTACLVGNAPDHLHACHGSLHSRGSAGASAEAKARTGLVSASFRQKCRLAAVDSNSSPPRGPIPPPSNAPKESRFSSQTRRAPLNLAHDSLLR